MKPAQAKQLDIFEVQATASVAKALSYGVLRGILKYGETDCGPCGIERGTA